MKKTQEDILKAVRQAIQNDDDMALAIKHVPDGKDENNYVTKYIASIGHSILDEDSTITEVMQGDSGEASMLLTDSAVSLYGKQKGVDLDQRQIDRLTFEIELQLSHMINKIIKDGENNNDN